MEQYKTDMSVDEVIFQQVQARLIRVPAQSAAQSAYTECLHRVLVQVAGTQRWHGVYATHKFSCSTCNHGFANMMALAIYHVHISRWPLHVLKHLSGPAHVCYPCTDCILCALRVL